MLLARKEHFSNLSATTRSFPVLGRMEMQYTFFDNFQKAAYAEFVYEVLLLLAG